jgi:hypothetical protein
MGNVPLFQLQLCHFGSSFWPKIFIDNPIDYTAEVKRKTTNEFHFANYNFSFRLAQSKLGEKNSHARCTYKLLFFILYNCVEVI